MYGTIEIIGKINNLLIPVFIMKLKVLSLERGEETAPHSKFEKDFHSPRIYF